MKDELVTTIVPRTALHAVAKWVCTLFYLSAVTTLSVCSSGCLTQFRTSSYDVETKSKEDTFRTNFQVESVSSGGFANEDKIRKALKKREYAQNNSLVPVPYCVKIGRSSEKIEADPLSNILFILSLTVWPSWEGTRLLYDIQTDVLGNNVSVRGTESETKVYGWMMLPTGVIGAFLMQDEPHIDFRSGTLEDRLAEATFNSLTKNRYDIAIGKMTAQAKQRLQDGRSLSETDERLLDAIPQQDLRLLRAKHFGNVAKSREALKNIDTADDLVDISLHASLLPIREEAATRVSGLSESRFAALVRETKDASVGEVFLKKVSDEELLRGIVEDPSAHAENRNAALERIKNELVLASVAKATVSPISIGQSAVKRIQTESVLEDVADNAAISEIRFVAIGKIDNERFLQSAVFKDSSAENRRAALAKVNDPAMLGNIVRKSNDVQIRLETVKRIKDRNVLNDIATNDTSESVRLTVLPRVKDPKTLERIAEQDSSEQVRMAAIKRVSNPETLSRIARNDVSSGIRLLALSGVKDAATIQDIVDNDSDAKVRSAAIEMVTDSKALGRIAQNHSEEDIRLAALSRVTDAEVIRTLATKDISPKVRRAAVQKLEEAGVLSLIAQQDTDSDVRMVAISKVNDAAVLAKIAINDSSSAVRQAAVEKIDDTGILATVVKNDTDSTVRRAALSKVDDRDVLADVAMKDIDAEIRCLAVGRISDQSILRNVAKNDRDSSVKSAAIRKLTDESKQLLVEAIRDRANHHNGLSLSGFYLGMDESDARLLFDVLLPHSSSASCATFSSGKVTKLKFSASELQTLLGNGRSLSVEMIPRHLERIMDCSFRYDPETVLKDGVTIAELKIYRFSSINGERLVYYVSGWEEDRENIGRLVRLAQLEAPYDDPGFYVIGYRSGLAEGIEQAKKRNPGMPPGTLVWEK